MISRPFSDLCRHCAVFYDSAGHYVGSQYLDYSKPVFTYKNKGYVFSPTKASFFKVIHLLYSVKYYFYNIDDPSPLIVSSVTKPVHLSSAEFGVFLETDVLKKLNDLAKKNWLAELLTPLNLVIGVVVIGILWYLNSTGKLG